MKKATYEIIDDPLFINTEGLKALTQSGRETAVKIGILAGAKVQIGRSVRWNVSRVRAYLDSIATE